MSTSPSLWSSRGREALLLCLGLALIEAASSQPRAFAFREPRPEPLRLRVGGVVVKAPTAPLVKLSNRLYIPTASLPFLGMRSRPAPGPRRVALVTPQGGELAVVSSLEILGEPMVDLEAAAGAVGGKLRVPPETADDAGVVTVLARIESVSISNGSLRVITGFPVPLRSGSTDAPADVEEFVDCAGTWIPDGFGPAAVDPADPAVSAIRLEARPEDVTRIVMRLKPSAVAPKPASAAPVRDATLTLADVLTAVDANYPKLQSAEAARLSADAKLTEKAGAFDPVFFGDAEYVRYNSSSKPGTLAHYFANDVGIEFPTPLGLKVYAGARMTEGRVKSPLSPTSRDGEVFFGLKLPLLRGLGINEKAAQLRQARLMLPQANAEFQAIRLEVLQKAAMSFWDWSAAGERLRVARALLSIADVRARAVSDEVDAGARAGIELVEATQEVQRRTEALGKAERDLQKEAYKLSLFLWDSSGSPAGVPTESMLMRMPLPAGPLDAVAVTQAEQAALQRRPELTILDQSRKAVEIDLKLARNLRLPQLDFGINPALDNGRDGVNSIKTGIALTVPLRQRTADGRVEQARLKLQKLDFDLQLERRRIRVEVLDLANAVQQTDARHRAAEQELRLAQQLEEGERERFRLGDSTLFLVNQRERATAEAAVKVISLQAEYQQSLAAFRAASADL